MLRTNKKTTTKRIKKTEKGWFLVLGSIANHHTLLRQLFEYLLKKSKELEENMTHTASADSIEFTHLFLLTWFKCG